ncbi:adenylyltransferase/cytidyltransferase family protein [Nitrosospira sp. Nsp13]|uniref:adenylyltransferase/cytidyltransferase family protein n=1 Tax=Nitrosospira sp. Nsp13 TaxID=1855332 RepID=UPI000891F8AA|nr:adenylyltransferase/cytidyltransferase family protein [Nitrosospira sp. Nsp13]SCX86865.1 cytidyltransferase-like domain-containing protein [Nitrosospira sp. Nsp13]
MGCATIRSNWIQSINSEIELEPARRKIFGYDQRSEIAIDNLVLTKGTFDILHAGHLALISYCSRLRTSLPQGRLAIIVESNESVKERKGPERPYQDEMARALQIALLQDVDYVIVSAYSKIVELISFLKPRYYIKGMDTTILDNTCESTGLVNIDLERNLDLSVLEDVSRAIIFTDDGELSTSVLIKNIRSKSV